MVGSMQAGKTPPALGLLRAEFELGMTAAGWVVSLLSVTAATVGILSGSVSDRIGNRRMIIICLGLICIGNVVGALSQTTALLLISRVIEGFGFVGIVVSAPSVLVRAASARHQKLVFGMWGAYMPAGMALMMAVAPLLLEPFGWRELWFANAAIAALFGLLFYAITKTMTPAAPPSERVAVGPAVVAVLGAVGPWLLGLTFMAYSMQWIALMAWLPTFMTESIGASIADAALVTALVVFLNVPGNLFGGWVLQTGAPRWSLPATAAVAMAASAYGIFVADIPDSGRIALALFFSFIAGLVPPTLFAGAGMHSPSPALIATTNGVIINGANIGVLLGPPILGAIIGAYGGWESSILMMGALGVMGLTTSLLLGYVERGR